MSQAAADGAAGARWRRVWWSLGAAVLVVALAVGGLVALRMRWPAARIVSDAPALARIRIAPFGEHVASAAIVLRSGRWVHASIHDGIVHPLDVLAAGSRVTVIATVRRAGWLGWLVGSTERVRSVVDTPATSVGARLLHPSAGSELTVAFSAPVAAVKLRFEHGPTVFERVSPRRKIVALGVRVAGAHSAGTVLVSGTPRLWERMPAAVRVDWFRAAPVPELFARPAAGATIEPNEPLVLTFSAPVSSLLGTRHPRMWPPAPGTWREPNAYTLVFQPSGLGYAIGAHLRLGLRRPLEVIAGADPRPVRTLEWSVHAGTTLGLEQALAQLGYLPLSWRPASGGRALTATAAALAAINPPAGSFDWRGRAPAALRGLWSSTTQRSVVLRGAVMAFQSANDLPTDGVVGRTVWTTLLEAELHHRSSPYGYSYVYVTETLPETLTLWHDGHVVLTTPVNTGIPGRDTALGTYPVYLHLTSTTMSGINPDGTPYNDPDVPWVNYFYGGDAVHGFYRSYYGYPQSLGCVEAPVPTAAEIFPYVQIGTLVTVVA